MNTDAEAKDTKYKTDKENVSETSKGADKETRKEADTPVKETGSEKESAGRSSVPPVNTEDNLELHSLPFRERQHARRQRLKDHMEGMTTGQKAGYILSYYKGKIILDGEDIKGLSTEVLRTRIGMVFQQPIAFPYSIEKNLSYVLKYHGIREAGEIERITRECLQKARLYDEIKDQLKKSAKKLSGGQKQRLAIARSLCVNPEILLLDEPCSALDMKNTIAIEETLLELKGKYTFVIVTHNLAQAKRIADQIIFMDQGRVLEVTDTKTFFEHPSSEPAREQIQYM